MLALTVALAACQPVPRPFVGSSHADVDLLTRPDNTGIVVAAIVDAPPAAAAGLAEAVAEYLREAGIPATSGSGNNSSTVLRGRVIDPGAEARIEWTLAAPGESEPVMFSQSIEGTPIRPWALGDPDLMMQLASAAAPQVVAMIQGEPIIEPVSATRVAVRPVTGAPGDGNASLTSAMRSALIDAGVELATEDTAGLAVAGTVETTPPAGGEQNIRISWLVTAGGGESVGRITQESPVAANSLDQYWGDVAVFVAQGAAVGIVEILDTIDLSVLAETVPAAGSADAEPVAAPVPPVAAASAAAQPALPENEARIAAAAPDAAPPPPRISTVGGWHVQLASFRERQQAERALEIIARQHTGLLGGYALDIEEAELATGRVYRVRTSSITNQSAATGLCRELQAAGQDCFVIRS